MDSIITYLLAYNQYLINIIFQLLLFISKYIPLQQLSFDDSNSPEYQKFKVDKLPKIFRFHTVDYKLLLAYYKHKYNKNVTPVQRRNEKSVPAKIKCPKCGAPHEYIYDNNGNKGQYQCKVCGKTFKESNFASKPLVFKCPYCGSTLDQKKERKHFNIHKCINKNCSYYKRNLKKLPKELNPVDKHKYKLHYIYREFNINFFKMNLYEVSKYATAFSFKKFNPHIMGLCFTYHFNGSAVIKPFVDTFDYKPSKILSADETYIKVKGIKHYVWIVMDACKKSILGYQVSDTRAVGPCILAMRMAFDKFSNFPNKALKFVADGYIAYPLAKQQFELEEDKIFKSSYRVTCGYCSDDGAVYSFALWVAYYNFLRLHPYTYWDPLNELHELKSAETMPAKWQILISLGQQTILNMQETETS